MKRCKLLSVLIMTVMITCMCLPIAQAKTKTKIAISDKKISIELGEEYQLSVTGTKSIVTWSSADNSVATVSDDGLVTAVAVGQVKVTGIIGTKKYSCTVKVKAATAVYLAALTSEMTENISMLIQDMVELKSYDENDDYYEFVASIDSVEEATASLYNFITNNPMYDGHSTTLNCNYDLSSISVTYGTFLDASTLTHNQNIKAVKPIADYVYMYRFLTQQSTSDVVFNFYQPSEVIDILITDDIPTPIDSISLLEAIY